MFDFDDYEGSEFDDDVPLTDYTSSNNALWVEDDAGHAAVEDYMQRMLENLDNSMLSSTSITLDNYEPNFSTDVTPISPHKLLSSEPNLDQLLNSEPNLDQLLNSEINLDQLLDTSSQPVPELLCLN